VNLPLKTIAGRYQLTAKIGEGGMGVVYRAYDPPPMAREVALKTLHEFADPLALELFYREVGALKSISHPNIVEIFDIGEFVEDGHRKPFFVMPLLQGQTLDELIRRASHRLTVDRVVEIISQTCRGLQAAHERGLIHRDLKPSNIFVMTDDSVKLIDFGVVRAADVHTASGFEKGTLIYMAPEQVQHKPVSIQSDIYALGVTAYEALTRRQPFKGATEEGVIHAILTHIPPPASELNPSVTQLISRVIHKAMAKQPWNRFDSAREFAATLQKAVRNEVIAVFDPSRIQPRIQTATRALEKGDYQFAGEIVAELEAEGNIDPQITLLRTQIDQIARQKTIAQLLDSARARFEEDEDPLALQKLQEVLHLDPGNVLALALKNKIDDRRSERQIDKWIQLARQHVDNHSYGHAREALQNAILLKPKDSRAARMLKDVESQEDEYVQLRREKQELYDAAVNAWKNGEVSQALSHMKLVLDLDRRAPDTSSPDVAGMYQSFYDRIRSEHDAVSNGYAEARRCLAGRDFARALIICNEFLAKYPGQALFQALKFDIDEQQRQQLSASIADVDRRLEAEPDLEAKVHLLRECVANYPDEPHFTRLLKLFEDKRDLVNSIVERARTHEERGRIAEALSDVETLQMIYAAYPGLSFEKERLQRKLEQRTRDTTRSQWVRQIDHQLQTGNYARATELLDKAGAEFPDDGELVELRRLARQGVERAARAEELSSRGQELCAAGQFDEGIGLLESALALDDRPSVRSTLRDVLVSRAQGALAEDWRTVETFADRALELDPNHSLARSLRTQALDMRREELVSQGASRARRLQAEGQIDAAMAEVDRILQAYPGEPRLRTVRESLVRELARTHAPAEDAPQQSALQPTVSVTQAPTRSASGAHEATRLVAGPRHFEPRRQAPENAAATPEEAAQTPTSPVQPQTLPVRERPSPKRPTRPPRTRTWIAVGAASAAAALGAALFVYVARTDPGLSGDREQPPSGQGLGLDANTLPASRDNPAPGSEAGATAAAGAAAQASPTAESPATLQVGPLPSGTQVLLDGKLLGVANADGMVTTSDVPPGRHSLQLAAPEYEPLAITRDFAAGEAVVLSGASVALTRAPVEIEFVADTTTEVSVSQNGRQLHRFTGPARLRLAAGSYNVVAQGPAGIPMPRTISVSASGLRTVDVRGVVSAMERFPTGSWTVRDEWYTRRGGQAILYDRRSPASDVTFTVRRNRGGFFSGGPRLKWLVGYADARNHVRIELDDDNLYLIDTTDGKQAQRQIRHNVPDSDQLHLNIQVSGPRLVHYFNVPGGRAWQLLDDWTRGTPIDGRFGFFLSGDEELQVTNFRYSPSVAR
jgi:serine/threonine-protein kinase